MRVNEKREASVGGDFLNSADMWTRPQSVDFPQVWWRFKAKDPETGEIVDYRIEDAAEDRFSEVVDLMMNYFVPDEPMGVSMGVLNDEVSLAEMRARWEDIVPKMPVLVCYKEGSSEICGLNVLEVLQENQKKDELGKVKGKCVRDVILIFDFLKAKADVYRRYNVDKYLHGLGLLVMPKYRGCGLATELLKARFPLMRALGLSVTGTVFSAAGSQGAARKAGFTEDVVASYESLGKESPFVQFPNISWPVVKFMCYQLK